ncbi:O-sialoglycoprotein endopeptidase [Kyrpidia spormannii]|uniref:N(6)-L-threonylcarbamoyladenine synthase n=2 Tax=Kyrpidia spormannii TaxID=2055160 RepID=A0ACA8Z7M3_9BACL|nr:O-sialoglycoprotein endopeptidase [Kyrpidia spormannii]CAB3391132.1 N(6)-L-threonylcarbamoyladenine synthase [Kyrpidia spormannii]CAB3392043.1 N(6)-L-threonylcarbamoyladenine synthase [Kyrpidia spormannii]
MDECYVLGIDTSNYTTSVCVLDGSGAVRFDGRLLLDVKRGERGLRQSEALFQHVRHLPELAEEMARKGVDLKKTAAVAASVRPRPAPDSYMPVFLAGEGLGRSLAAGLQVPFYAVSHQEGHLAAAEADVGDVPAASFLAAHVSGGTTDILRVERKPGGYRIDTLGQSMDLHAGQLIDRVGVALGLPFPAGPALERLAQSLAGGDSGGIALPVFVRGCSISFSGPQTRALRWIEDGASPAQVAMAVQRCVARALEKALLHALAEHEERHILMVGGVASNAWIRHRLTHRLSHPAVGAVLHWAGPEYSRDNARGVARLGLAAFREELNSV